MNHWAFVVAAYVLACGATALLLAQSFLAMRRAERALDRDRRER